MGAIGYYLSNRASLPARGGAALPALYALSASGGRRSARPRGAAHRVDDDGSLAAAFPAFARNRAFVIFLVCVLLFDLANGAMLPLAASMMTLKSSKAATLMVAASIVVPQFIVTLLSPWVGLWAQRIGRKPILLLGFGALALRGFLFASTGDPALLTLVQALDGVSAAVLGVLVPLTAVDVTRVAWCISTWPRAAHRLHHGYRRSRQLDIGAAMSATISAATPPSPCWRSLAAASVVILALAMPETETAILSRVFALGARHSGRRLFSCSLDRALPARLMIERITYAYDAQIHVINEKSGAGSAALRQKKPRKTEALSIG